MIRKGGADNVMIFPENDYDTSGSFTRNDNEFTFTHKALGADMFRYSWNFGKNWTSWSNWEDVSTLNSTLFSFSENFWQGSHIVVQCMLYPPKASYVY